MSPLQIGGVLTREQRCLSRAALWQSVNAERRVERHRSAKGAAGPCVSQRRHTAAHQLQQGGKRRAGSYERIVVGGVLTDPYTVQKKQQDAGRPFYLRRPFRARPTARSSRPSGVEEPPVKKSTTTESGLSTSNNVRMMSPTTGTRGHPFHLSSSPSTAPEGLLGGAQIHGHLHLYVAHVSAVANGIANARFELLVCSLHALA